MRMRLLMAILALALIPVAGCGGNGNGQAGDYVDDFNEIQTSFEESVDGAALADPEQAPDTLEQMATEADRSANELREVDPPEEVAEQHNEMIALYEEIRDVSREALELASGELDAESAEALDELGDHLVAAGERADALTAEMAEELGTEVEE